MSKKLIVLILVIVAGCALSFVCIGIAIMLPSTPIPTRTAVAASANEETTQAPDPISVVASPAATDTPQPTNTEEPTAIPSPTFTATIAPDPVILSGSGDSIVDVVNPFGAALIHVTGNAEGRFFAVTNYDSNGEQIDLLVNTTDPYDGIRPLDFLDNEETTRFEVKAIGDWTIEIVSLDAARYFTAPTLINGDGDEVIFVEGASMDLLKVTGNSDGRFFGVTLWGGDRDTVIITTDPYNGSVIIPKNVITEGGVVAIEVQAIGDWTIEVTTK